MEAGSVERSRSAWTGRTMRERETKVVRFRKKAALEDNVSEMRNEEWEPRWESYRETQTGVLVRRMVYSVVMERKQRKLQWRGFRHILKLLFPGKQHSSRALPGPSSIIVLSDDASGE